MAQLFLLMADIRVGNRPGRVEPRAVKQRPKAYPRLQKHRYDERERINKRRHSKKSKAQLSAIEFINYLAL